MDGWLGGWPSDRSILTAAFLLKSCSALAGCLDFCWPRPIATGAIAVAYAQSFIENKNKRRCMATNA